MNRIAWTNPMVNRLRKLVEEGYSHTRCAKILTKEFDKDITPQRVNGAKNTYRIKFSPIVRGEIARMSAQPLKKRQEKRLYGDLSPISSPSVVPDVVVVAPLTTKAEAKFEVLRATGLFTKRMVDLERGDCRFTCGGRDEYCAERAVFNKSYCQRCLDFMIKKPASEVWS